MLLCEFLHASRKLRRTVDFSAGVVGESGLRPSRFAESSVAASPDGSPGGVDPHNDTRLLLKATIDTSLYYW